MCMCTCAVCVIFDKLTLDHNSITAAPPGETLVQHGVVHGAGRLVVRVDRVLVAEQLGAGPLLLSQSQLSTAAADQSQLTCSM